MKYEAQLNFGHERLNLGKEIDIMAMVETLALFYNRGATN
jgi:hypothetical protein